MYLLVERKGPTKEKVAVAEVVHIKRGHEKRGKRGLLSPQRKKKKKEKKEEDKIKKRKK